MVLFAATWLACALLGTVLQGSTAAGVATVVGFGWLGYAVHKYGRAGF